MFKGLFGNKTVTAPVSSASATAVPAPVASTSSATTTKLKNSKNQYKK